MKDLMRKNHTPFLLTTIVMIDGLDGLTVSHFYSMLKEKEGDKKDV
ncbi:MAG: hypothetical protein AB1847_05860 [bacterium]